jgi:hypothetical protein
MKAMLRKRLHLQSGWIMPDDRRAALAEANSYLLQTPELAKVFVTNVYDFEEVHQAFSAAAIAKPGQKKIAIQIGL